MGYIKDLTDRNGNKISFGYTYDSDSVGDEYRMVSMTDTQGPGHHLRAGRGVQGHQDGRPRRAHPYLRLRPARRPGQSGQLHRPHRGGYPLRLHGSVLGLLSRVTDALGNVTTFTYDSRDRVTALSRSGGTWRFDCSTPWQTKVTDPNGRVTTH